MIQTRHSEQMHRGFGHILLFQNVGYFYMSTKATSSTIVHSMFQRCGLGRRNDIQHRWKTSLYMDVSGLGFYTDKKMPSPSRANIAMLNSCTVYKILKISCANSFIILFRYRFLRNFFLHLHTFTLNFWPKNSKVLILIRADKNIQTVM